jgi:hypothetical protein
MKTKTLTLAAAAMVVAHAAVADVTVNITGATAFRVATLDSIKAQFVASGQPFKFAHDRNAGNNQSFNGATRAIFEGTFPGVSGTTTIRTSFNGSVQGLSALVNSPAADPTYLEPSVLDGITPVVGGNNGGNGQGSTTSPTVAAQSDVAFSDVSIAATPFAGNALQPSNPEAGVVIFTMIANEGAAGILSNFNTQNFRALWGAGALPLSFFTGNAADTDYVFATGRNDGSGTRTTYLAESGFGVANTVQQYVVGGTSGDTITAIYRVPAGGTSAGLQAVTPALTLSANNASTIWGQDIDGNGGYSSGSALRGDMGRTSASTTVYDVDGSDLFGGPVNVHLVSWLSNGDAAGALINGAVILGYNGERLDDFATSGTLSAADEAKITQGVYTAWSYQQMYRRGDITSGDKVTVYNNIKNNLVLGVTGLSVNTMAVGRPVDGGVVVP